MIAMTSPRCKLIKQLVAVMLLALIARGAAQAADADASCTFNPPAAILQPKAYAGYAFKRAPQNNATEKVQLRSNLRLEIAMSQCADLIVHTFTFTAVDAAKGQHDDRYWLDVARTEIAALRRKEPAPADAELDQFLLHARTLAPQAGTRSACKDGSKAASGQCTWESGGGYIVEVKKVGANVTVSVTEYTSA